MRLAAFSPLTTLAGLAAGLAATLLAPAPAMAQVEPTFENAVSCALIYRYLGDRGPAYEQLVAKTAQIGGQTVADIRTELDEREPRLLAGIADGRLDPASFDSVVANACPKTFGVAPATPPPPAIPTRSAALGWRGGSIASFPATPGAAPGPETKWSAVPPPLPGSTMAR
ncbi:MAG: hypothetical protein GXC70_13130 [Sphingomonadaceae bacterium]|nr:hypothetical protein [Sphingomonadaceae bacterium]